MRVTTQVERYGPYRSTWESNSFQSIELLIRYNFIVTRSKSSFHKTVVENFTGYLLGKNSSVYVKI